jgi:hypothetical protein
MISGRPRPECRDEKQPAGIVIDFGRITEFWKTPPATSNWTTCLEFAGADGVSIARNHVFI